MPRPRRASELVVSAPSDQLIAELVRQLADAVDGQAAYCIPSESDPAQLQVVAASPELVQLRGGLPGESAREPVRGGGLLLVASRRRRRRNELPAIRETAGWLGIAAEVERARAERDRAEARARRLHAEVTTARERLAQVRDLERSRLVRAITTTALRDLADLRRRISALGEPAAQDELLPEITELGAAVDELLDSFRTIVRGVYPAMLPDEGPRAALEELAMVLPRPVRFGGELGRRTGWEVESGFYHAVAAVLNLLAGSGTDADPAVVVEFRRDGAMQARVASKADGLSTSDLRAALDHDAERIAVLGGAMDSAVIDGTAVVSVQLADRTVDAGTSFGAQGDALHERVRELVEQGRHELGSGSGRDRWDVVAARLTAAPRLAVVTDEALDDAQISHTWAVGVALVVAGGPADQELAERFLSDDDPQGSIDAVLSHVPPSSEFLAALRRSPQRVEVSRGSTLGEVARKLAARAPVIAARRALVSVRAELSGLSEDHHLRWAVDRLAAEAHEIAELDLLDAVLNGEIQLPTSVAEDAARLLGAHGVDPRARLGLVAASDEEQVSTAAQRAVLRWRGQAGGPVLGGREASACEVLVRTAEGLLNGARAR